MAYRAVLANLNHFLDESDIAHRSRIQQVAQLSEPGFKCNVFSSSRISSNTSPGSAAKISFGFACGIYGRLPRLPLVPWKVYSERLFTNSIESKLVTLLFQDADRGLVAMVSLETFEPVDAVELESLRGRFSIRKSGSE